MIALKKIKDFVHYASWKLEYNTHRAQFIYKTICILLSDCQITGKCCCNSVPYKSGAELVIYPINT